MKQAVLLLILSWVVSGCARTGENFSFSGSRYRGISRQSEYVAMRVPVNSRSIIGKSKEEVRALMGVPARVQNQTAQGIETEAWMYYPESTDNFIAIIIRFSGDIVTTCQYESVM